MRKFLATALGALALVGGTATTANADVVRSGNVLTASPAECSCVTTIDGYVFSGMPYYDASPEADSAVELWWELRADPDYLSLPPVTSVSTDTTVSGSVGDDGSASPDRSSWG